MIAARELEQSPRNILQQKNHLIYLWLICILFLAIGSNYLHFVGLRPVLIYPTLMEKKKGSNYLHPSFWKIINLLDLLTYQLGVGNRVTIRVRVDTNRVLGFRILKNQPQSDIIKVRTGLGSDPLGFGSDLVTNHKPGWTHLIFGFGSKLDIGYPYSFILPELTVLWLRSTKERFKWKTKVHREN